MYRQLLVIALVATGYLAGYGISYVVAKSRCFLHFDHLFSRMRRARES